MLSCVCAEAEADAYSDDEAEAETETEAADAVNADDQVVGEKRLELIHQRRQNLNLVRLPIPPFPHGNLKSLVCFLKK